MTTMSRKTTAPFISALLAALALSASAQDRPGGLPGRVPYLAASGTGTARATPDVVYVTLGVTTGGKRAQEASQNNATATQRVMEALKAQGIDTKDIQTSNYSVQPLYKENNANAGIQGYQVSNLVRATVRKTATAGKVIDAALDAGANNVQGVYFGLEDRAAAEERAMTDAVQAARRKAEVMARAAGVRLTGILQIDGNADGGRPIPLELNGGVMARMAAPTPISEGEMSVTANVSILFRIEDPNARTTDARPPVPTERELAQAKSQLQLERARLLTTYAANHPKIREIEDQIRALDAQLTLGLRAPLMAKREELMRQRATLLQTLTPNHPKVREVMAQIEALTQQIDGRGDAPQR
jgi:uncharacterized protein YggE